MSIEFVSLQPILNQSYSSHGSLMCLPTAQPPTSPTLTASLPIEPPSTPYCSVMQEVIATDHWDPSSWWSRFPLLHRLPPPSPQRHYPSPVVTVSTKEEPGIGDVVNSRGLSAGEEIKNERRIPGRQEDGTDWTTFASSPKPPLHRANSCTMTVRKTSLTDSGLSPVPFVSQQLSCPTTELPTLPHWRIQPICAGCEQTMDSQNPCLRLSDGRLWHMDCLVCAHCTKPLHLDRSCFCRDDQIYCKDDYQRLFVGTKRTLITCAACQRPIHAQDLVMRALHAIYHYTCFTCRQCHRLLQPGEHFVLRHGQLMCNHLACQAREPRDQSSFEPNSMSNPRSTESNSHDSSATGEPTTPHSFPFRPFEQSEELVLLSSSSVDKTVSPNESDYAKRDVSGSNLGQDVVAQMIVTSVCEQFAGFPKQTQMDEDNEIESGSPNRTSHSNGFPRLVSTNRFMCDLNINPLYRSGDLIEPENEIRTDSNTMNRLDLSSVPLPFPQSTSPTPGVYGLLAENDFTPTVIYPHLNRSPKMTPLPPGDVGSMNPNPLLSQIQNRLCPIRGMSQGGVCEDLAKLVSYSSFLPTTGVSPIPSSPRIGTANSLLKLIEPGTSMLYGPNGVITGHSIPGPGPLLLAQSAQKRNRKRRTGLHQTFDGVCVTSPNGYCVGLSQRQKRMRTSFKHHQLRAMKAYFNMNHNPDVKDLKVLTEKTGLSKRVLQVWFQNARAKYRRSLLRQDGPNSSNSTNVNSSNNNTNSNATTTTTTNNNNNNINLMSTTISVINTTTTASNITSNVTNITANGMTTSSTGSTSDLALLSNNSLSDCDSKSSHFDMTEVGSHLSPKSLYPHNHSFMTDEGTDSAMDLLAEIRRPQMTVKTDDSAGIYGLGLVASPPLPIGSALPSTFEVQRSRTPTTTFTFISSGCRQRDLCTLGSIHG